MEFKQSTECIILMGGSFDPIHSGHVAIANYFCNLFHTKQLRLIPAGNPWQKKPLKATPAQRIEMIQLAFDDSSLSITIDNQEITRKGPNYSIDTLSTIRNEVGNKTSLIFIIGADQLLNLNTWYEWKKIFTLVHVAVALRPEFSITTLSLPEEVRNLFFNKLSSPNEIIKKNCGLTYLAENPLVDISSTKIRKNIYNSERCRSLVPSKVLNYIMKHDLYRN